VISFQSNLRDFGGSIDCSYFINATEPSSISLTIWSRSLQRSVGINCQNDWLLVRSHLIKHRIVYFATFLQVGCKRTRVKLNAAEDIGVVFCRRNTINQQAYLFHAIIHISIKVCMCKLVITDYRKPNVTIPERR